MNREEFIAEFREKVLPKYIKLAEEDPYVVEVPIKKIIPVNLVYKKCKKCHTEKPASEFYGRYHYCKACKIKYQMQRYFSNRIKFYKEKKKQLSRRRRKSE